MKGSSRGAFKLRRSENLTPARRFAAVLAATRLTKQRGNLFSFLAEKRNKPLLITHLHHKWCFVETKLLLEVIITTPLAPLYHHEICNEYICNEKYEDIEK